MSEKSIQNTIMLEVGKQCPRTRIFRNNTGKGVCGSRYERAARQETVTLNPGDWVVRNGRMVDFGLCHGAGDFVGWDSITITPSMAGLILAVFLSIEVKDAKGAVRPEQATWANNVRAAGGKAIIARSVEDAVNGIACGGMF
jgi:hypothetical protein